MQRAAVPVRVQTINAGKLRRYKHLNFWQHFTVKGAVRKNIFDVFKTGAGFVQSIWILMRFRPDVVFAKGGYVCLPMGFAARLLRIPLVIHDSDTRPGLTNRLLARFAAAIGTGSPLENYTYDPVKSRYVGVPISAEFTPVSVDHQRTLKRALGCNSDAPLVVVVGGERL